jgi:hypothetical protein
MPLSPEQIAAAQAAFGSPLPAPPTQAQQAGLVLPWQSAAPPPRTSLGPLIAGLAPETVAQAQAAFGPPAPPPAPAPAPPPVQVMRPAAAPAPVEQKPVGPSLASRVREDQRAVLGAIDRQAQAKGREGQAVEAQGAMRAAALGHEAERQAAHAQAQVEAYRQADALHQQYMGRTQAMIDDLARQQVDPHRLFASKSTAEKMVFALGGIIGGIQQALGGGGENQFLRTVEALKREDVEEQESRLANARTAIQARQSVYGQMREALGSRQAAEAAYGLAMAQAAETQLAGMAASSGSVVDRERYAQAQAQIDEMRAKYQTQLDSEALKNAQSAAATAASRQAAAIEKMVARRAQAFETALKEGYAPDQAARIADYQIGAGKIDDISGMLPAAKVAAEAAKGGAEAAKGGAAFDAELRQAKASWDDAVRSLPSNRLSSAASGVFGTDARSKYQAATASLVTILKKQGMSSDADMALLRELTPLPGDDEETVQQKWRTVANILRTKHPEAAARLSEAPERAVQSGMMAPQEVVPSFQAGSAAAARARR